MADSLIQGAKGLTAVTAATAPTVGPVYGDYLISHGIGLLSFSEIIQVIGSVYVLFLLSRAILSASICKSLVSKIKSWFD